MIFVFGSNLAGRHGKGAALHALNNYGAIRGQGEGRQGASYAIPTKDKNLQPLPLSEIENHVDKFIAYAIDHPELEFFLTAIGTGLTGYKPEHIAPMFRQVPSNVMLPKAFK